MQATIKVSSQSFYTLEAANTFADKITKAGKTCEVRQIGNAFVVTRFK